MWPVDATPAHLDRLDQTVKRLVGLFELRALIDAAVAVELATCGKIAAAIGALDSDPKNQESDDRYRPSQELRRTITARDMHCRFPGCRIPINKCDLDHTIDAALGGPTQTDNLAYLCRRHHSLKHHTPWKVEQLENGKLKWTSPIGYVYLEPPPSNAMFKPPPQPNSAASKTKARRLKNPLFNFDGPPPF